MTREIVLHCMKSASELERELCEECPIYGQTGCDHCYEDALQYVIAMLEQEPKTDTWSIKDVADTLAKHGLIAEQEPTVDAVPMSVIQEIKAEINYVGAHSDYGMQCVFAVAIAIIDKHLERVVQDE